MLMEFKTPIIPALASRGTPTMGKQSQWLAPSFTVCSVMISRAGS